MTEIKEQIHKEIDEQLSDPAMLLAAAEPDSAALKYKYFAADVIAENYSGKYIQGLACACQCFLNARLIHRDGDIDANKVLLGDYFTALIAGFDLPEDSYELLEKFADFTIKEIELDQSGEEEASFIKRYGELFKEIAGGMDE